MDDLDLDSFIANIEETAPEDIRGARLMCQECGVQLEEQEDGNYTCPGCSAQATNILQLDETELHHDDQGRPLHGQRVMLTERKSKHQIDYGWAWSTDEAVSYILSLQINALEKARLLPEFFRTAITNMWLKFWLENIAPHIKDEYRTDELIPISTKKALKLRDVEVLVKLHDKVMIPFHQAEMHQNARLVYKMYGSRFYPVRPEDRLTSDDIDDLGDSSSSIGGSSTSSSLGDCDQMLIDDQPTTGGGNNDDQPLIPDVEPDPWLGDGGEAEVDGTNVKHKSTRNLSDESIAILTLNRTLAFIEATSRCLKHNDPLFAADIIRACNQRLIPFYNAGKLLPESMKLTPHDRLMFQKTRPPTPVQLTRTACLLIHRIYKDQPPKVMPVPDLSSILERFIQDLNLPYELYDLIRDQYSFADFTQTRPMILNDTTQRRLPQYDRWTFAVLLCQLKKLFNLSDIYIRQQSDLATQRSSADQENCCCFDLSKWVQQLSLKLKLILRYDAFVLHHPLAELDKLEPTPQLAKYIELILEDRTSSTVKLQPNAQMFDEVYRKELCDFIQRELPLPEGVDPSLLVDEELDTSANIRYPISDAIDRTRRFWEHQFDDKPQVIDLIFKNFTTDKLVLPSNVPRWSIYDDGLPQSRWRLKISPDWPYTFKLLLNAGAFLCFCDPVDMLNEVRLVDEKFYPEARAINRRSSSSNKNKT